MWGKEKKKEKNLDPWLKTPRGLSDCILADVVVLLSQIRFPQMLLIIPKIHIQGPTYPSIPYIYSFLSSILLDVPSSPTASCPTIIATPVPISARTPWTIGYLGPDVTALLPPELYGSRKCLDCLPDNVTSMTFFPGLLLYQDFEGAKNVTSIYCTPSQAYVESTILCTKEIGRTQTCAVTAQRLSTLPHMPTELTYLSFSQIFTGLSSLLPNTTQQINHIDLLQNYIAYPYDSPFIQSSQWPALSASSNNESRFLDLPLEDFGARLGQIINSFLFGSMQNSTEFLTGSSAIPQDSGPATDDGDLVSAIQNETVTFTVPTNVTTQQDVYVCSFPWLGAYLAAALAMPLAAIAAAILHRLTKAREYLGYVSSVVRESQFAGMPKGGVNMDGIERTRGLRKLRVRLGDVGNVEGGVEIGTGVAIMVGQLAVGEEGTSRSIDERKLYI